MLYFNFTKDLLDLLSANDIDLNRDGNISFF